MRLIDISHELLSAPLYPGDPPAEVEKTLSRDRGDDCNCTKLSTSVHKGTHTDAPCHFTDLPVAIADMPLEHYFGDCLLVDYDGETVDDNWLRALDMQGCRILIVRGGAFFSANAGAILREKGVITLGTDALSVGPVGGEKPPHQSILAEKIAIIETLKLDGVAPGRYFLSAPPVKIAGSDGAPVRAVLIEWS